MFCTKCGFDCGNANFCQRCGNDLRQNTGSNMPATPTAGDAHLAPPVGKYTCLEGSLELTHDTVIIRRSWPHATLRVIPYSQIQFVTHMRRSKTQQYGFLSIYTFQSTEPLVSTNDQASGDSMSVLYSWAQNENTIFQIFCFLSECASQNRWNWLEIQKRNVPPDILELAQSKYELKHYRQYYPHKEEGISALQADTGMEQEKAQQVVEYVFNTVTIEIYEKINKSIAEPHDVCCTQCASPIIASRPRGYDHLRASSFGGRSIGLLMTLGFADAYKDQYICMKCGYVWLQE